MSQPNSSVVPSKPLYALHRDPPGSLSPQSIDGKSFYSLEQAVKQITRSGSVLQDWNSNGEIELTYSFPTTEPQYFKGNGVSGFSPFSAQKKQQAALAMQSWADVANVTFTESKPGLEGHLTFGNFDKGKKGASAFTTMPDGMAYWQGHSWYRAGVKGEPGVNNYARQTLAHEIGHNLGLDHPGNYNARNGKPSYKDAVYWQDTVGYSIMSYWSESNTGQDFGGIYSSGPLIDDIAAVQKLYGANYSTRSGDTTYGFNSNTNRDYMTASSPSDKLVFAVWDGGGNDTLDFSRFTQGQSINLNAGAFSSVGGLVGNVSIAKGVILENAVGGSGDDVILGNEANNRLVGGEGGDILYGAAGHDILDGGHGNDWLAGGPGHDVLAGGAGRDWLYGGEGRDTFAFTQVSDSTPGAADWIMDFASGEDRIDLTGITQGAGLSFVDAFTGQAGQVVLTYDQRFSKGSLEIDFSGNGLADFQVTTVGRMLATDIVA